MFQKALLVANREFVGLLLKVEAEAPTILAKPRPGFPITVSLRIATHRRPTLADNEPTLSFFYNLLYSCDEIDNYRCKGDVTTSACTGHDVLPA